MFRRPEACALRRIVMEDMGMDSQRFDRITKKLATGLSRRSAMKGVAAALGLSAVGALHAPTIAAKKPQSWTLFIYDCPETDTTPSSTTCGCGAKARSSVRDQNGVRCPYDGNSALLCNGRTSVTSESECEACIAAEAARGTYCRS
jgi:hypothetical protein